MRLTEYLEPDRVILGLETTGVEDTLRELVSRLGETGAVSDPESVTRALMERERNHTTSLGNGVALPHATVPAVDAPVILVGVARNGVRFGPAGQGQAPDRVFFVLLSPPDAAGTHIKMLARIVRLVRSPDLVDRLVEAGSGEEVVATIADEDALHV